MDPLYLDALATLETANGQKTIKGPKGEDSNNLFNIKDFSGGGFRARDVAEGSNDAYRVYPSREASKDDLIALLSRKYPKALEATTPQDFATALKAGGYATDPKYVEKFVGVHQGLVGSGQGDADMQPAPAPLPPADRSLSALYDAAVGPRPPKALKQTATAAAAASVATILPVRTSPIGDSPEAWFARSSEATTNREQAASEANQQSLREVAKAQFMDTFGGEIIKRLSRDAYPSDGTQPTENELEGFTAEEQQAIKHGASKAEREQIMFEIRDHNDRMQEAGKSGPGYAIAGAMIAGGPEAYVTGGVAAAGLARAGLGSLKLAEAGRRGAAAASMVAENVGVSAGMTATQDYLTPYVHAQDYVIGAIGDSIGMALHAPTVLRASRKAEADVLGKVLDDALASKRNDIDAARTALGPDASPDDVARAAGEAQAERIRSSIEAHTSTLGEDRQLIPRELNDELFGDTPAAPVEGASKMEFPSLSDASDIAAKTGLNEDIVNLPYNGSGVIAADALGSNIRNLPNATPENLAAGWRRDNPHGAAGIRQFEREYGLSYDKVLTQTPPRAVSFARSEGLDDSLKRTAQWLHKTFLPDYRVVVINMANTPAGAPRLDGGIVHGDAWNVGRDISVIRVRPGDKAMNTLIHEFGHVIFDRNVQVVKQATREGFQAVHEAWLKRYTGSTAEKPAAGLSSATDAAIRRGSMSSDYTLHSIGVKAPEGFIPSLMDVMARVVDKVSADVKKVGLRNVQHATQYIPNIQEFSAEQFTKYIEAAAHEVLDWKPASMPEQVKQFFAKVYDQFATLYNRIKQAGLIAPEQGVVQFYDEVRKSAKASVTKRERLAKGLPEKSNLDGWDAASPLEGPSSLMTTPGPAGRTDADIARQYGFDTLDTSTPAKAAEFKAMAHLYRKAAAYPMPDKARISKLLSTAPMGWAAPTALKLLTSKNPVARMVAAELLESGGGAGGRRTTAAIGKWIHEREFMGNTVNEFQAHYTDWRNANGGGIREDFMGGKKFDEFNRRVAAELENRHNGRTSSEAQAVRNAADVLSSAYERMRSTQTQLRTPGWASLPADSHGYMPHRMAPGKIRAMTPDQGRVLHGVMAEQFQAIEGFDEAFSNKLASKYIDIIRKRGTAGYAAPIGVHNSEAADIVAQSAAAMGMSRDEANALAKRVLRSQPAHTRHRLNLDLTRSYEADGRQFQLLDLFETDQLTLVRSQASRVSGEAALVKHGIMGSTGMKLLRRAMDFGSTETKADNATLEALDQVTAELLGAPFGTQTGRWLDRALQFNSLASLGGMGFNQIAETLNGVVSLGARHALASVGSFSRLRSEIIALSHGKQVNNPIIGSLETYGAEFGTDHYKMVFPFDNPSRTNEVFGVEDLTAADRLLRAGSHLQGKLSLWRAISSAQERGMAEQIVHKALRYIREGKDDVALADMGIDNQVMQAFRKELPNVAKFENGRLTEFDITKMEDRRAADAFVQAVHRGTKQIIQGTFIGETGKWAHSGFLKLLTQFRSFSMVAIDKQWNRTVGNYGTPAALGLLLGTMSFAAPIMMIRAGISSIGRPDQEEYLQKRLHPVNIARETLNYVALSGMAGDLLDATSAVAGYQPTGGRTGTNKSFVGNVVAPAAGKANDIWGALQNTKDGTDIHGLVQQLPFARLPWLIPAVTSLKADAP